MVDTRFAERVMTCFVGATQDLPQFGAWFGHKVDASFVACPFHAMVRAIGKIGHDYVWLFLLMIICYISVTEGKNVE